MSIEQAQHLITVGRWAQAREALARPLADPQSGSDPWCLLAQCEIGLGQPLAARDAARRALAIDPQRVWGYRLLAIAERSNGQLAAAQEAAERGLALEPDSPEMAHTMILILLARRKNTEAERLAVRNLENNSIYALAWESAANVSLRRSRWTECEERARRALAIDPQDTDVMLILGVALQAQGKHAEAGELYGAVSRIDPTDNRGREALGELGLRVSNSRRPNALRWLLLLLPQAWLGLLIGQVRQSLKQRRARAGLSPHLREVTRREQRAAAGTRLFVTAMVALVLGIIWLLAQQWVIAGLALALAIATLAVWRSWAPAQGRRWASAVRDPLRSRKPRQRT